MKRHNHLISVFCLLAALPAVGCTQTYKQLATIEEIPSLASLAKNADAAGDRMTRVPVDVANGTTLSVAIHESGRGDADRIFVFIHGVVADSKSWRFIRGGLTEFDTLAVDLPGCGESDAPEAKALGEEAYSPTFMASCILQAVRARLEQRPAPVRSAQLAIPMVGVVRLDRPAMPAKITLVGHSLGAMPILRMYGDEALRDQYKDILDRVDSVVLLSPADVGISQPSPTIQKLLDLKDTDVGLAECLALTRELVSKGEMEGVAYGQDALQWSADRTVKILTDPTRRHAMQAMIRAAVPNNGGEIDWSAAQAWQERYSKLNVPSLIVWGSRDTTLPVAMAHQMHNLIPNSRLCILDPAKHCLMVEQPQVCVDLIRNFVGGKLETGPIVQLPVKPAQRSNSLASNR